jgi:predicted DNA-binding protein
MPRISFTLRIDPEERAALENLSKIEGRPVHQLLDEAIKLYLNRRSQKEETAYAHATKLRAYRQRYPGLRRAAAAFVDADASLEDPLEGEPIEVVEEPAGPVQRTIRRILDT